ncbi:hypothetical protein M427DRAFT_142567 [Gonapodya prolifera JEL478]|uniref:L domain-like protein n=1 Tax=Gonapodya prolifera (strain JEL478) TaxID=1344416 RepID=A0A139AVQ9_GONPJ|nr:hypothetical protein M427DRAFT_142567 [Gonapodya prolifera JEL478]|eukprot:KXS20816.1 hypothetical protein M427DRAFT_142567 [Gonapodya prolifera JEL478]
MLLLLVPLLLLFPIANGQTEAVDCAVFETIYRNSNITLPWNPGRCCSLTYNNTQATSFNCENGRIVGAFLYQQNLRRPLPALDLTEIRLLWIYNNKLSGRVPLISNLKEMQSFHIGINDFEGPLPSFSGLPNLLLIDVSRNRINGTIPSFQDRPDLLQLTQKGNYLTGNIPDLSFRPYMSYLELGSSNLTGNIDGQMPQQVDTLCSLVDNPGLYSCKRNLTLKCFISPNMVPQTGPECPLPPPPVAPIAGGVIGGLAIVVALMAALFYIKKRRRRSEAVVEGSGKHRNDETDNDLLNKKPLLPDTSTSVTPETLVDRDQSLKETTHILSIATPVTLVLPPSGGTPRTSKLDHAAS